MLFALWIHGSYRRWANAQLYGLVPRLSAILVHLCDQLSAQNGYIALREDQVFEVQTTHNMTRPSHVLDQANILADEPDIVLKIPLETQTGAASQVLGVVALGPRQHDHPYTPQEIAFLNETVAELLTTSLRHNQQLERFAEAIKTSIQKATLVQQRERDLQRAFSEALRFPPREITSNEVKEALTLMRDARNDDLSALGELELAHNCLVVAELRCRGIEHPTAHQRGQALKAVLIREIEAMKPESPRDLNEEAWIYYLILRKAFVRGKNWKRASHDLYMKRAAFFRWRDKAIKALTARIQNKMGENDE